MPELARQELDVFVADFNPVERPNLRVLQGGLGQSAAGEISPAAERYDLDQADLSLLQKIFNGVPIPTICWDEGKTRADITEHALVITDKLEVPTVPSAMRKVIVKEILPLEKAPASERPHLTPLEYKVITLISRGMRNGHIAKILPINPAKLAEVVTPVLRSKLDAESNAHAVVRAFKLTILKKPPKTT